MWKLGITAAAGTLAALLAGQAQAAAPTCTTTNTIASGTTATLAQLSGGNCVQVGDKIFGSASIGGAITGAGTALFTINNAGNFTTVGFLGGINGTTTGNINYSVAVAPGSTDLISAFQQDITIQGLSASATLVGGGQVSLSCTNTTLASGATGPSTCPILQSFAPNVPNLTVTQTVTGNSATTTVTAITDTIFQTAAAPVPEPTTLMILGSALVGFGLIRRRRKNV